MGVDLIAISVDAPDLLAKARAKSGAVFPFVGDPDGKLLDVFGLRHSGGHPVSNSDIARPASVLILRDGTVAWSSYAENYRVRPTVDTSLREASKALSEAESPAPKA